MWHADEALRSDGRQRGRKRRPHGALFLCGKEIREPLRRFCRRPRMNRREHERPRLGRRECRTDRLAIAQFRNQQDIGVFAQRAAHGRIKRRKIPPELALMKDAAVLVIEKFHGVFERNAVQMAAASNSLGRIEEAEKCLREAIPVLEQCGNLQSWAIAGNQMGDIMLEKGDSASAACYFEKSLKVFESRGDAYNMSHSHYGLGRALMPADPSLAANHIMKYTQIRDSLYNSEMKRGLNEYHAIYGNDRLLEEMDHGRMIRRRLIVMGIALLLIMSGLLCIIFLRMRHARLSLERAMARITELENQTKEIHEDDKPAAGPDSGNEFLHRLTDIALEVITEGNVDYELIASRMCISRAHLNRKVKALAGCTTTDFILAIRISKAKELLRGTSLPVWEVAQRCGFHPKGKLFGQTPLIRVKLLSFPARR